MHKISEIEELIKSISRLPGLGPKSARRIILKLINNREEIMRPMLNSLSDLFKNVIRCQSCGSLKSVKEGCNNCENLKKKFNKICIVENIADQWSIENSTIYEGYFHILGGNISDNKLKNKKDMLVDSLISRIKKESIEEVIIATSATIEGQTTAFYIQDSLKNLNIKISKLAQGVPVGGEIESLDDGTLISAFKNRKTID
tara:strand:+ start:861 stop:1463 length:603 start_codon:yes stop_codon:yes gene_type:complete